MKVVVCGMAGVGKNTLGEAIAEEFDLDFYSGGDILKEIAREEGYQPTEDWWDTEEGMKFVREREKDSKFDKELDEKLMNKLDQGEVVVTSRTMPWLYDGDCFNIWLKAPQKVRAKRIAKRDGISFKNALEKVKERDKENKELYNDLYGIKLGEDFEPFDMIVDTVSLSIEEMCSQVIDYFKIENKG